MHAILLAELARQFTPLLARVGRLIRGLREGDPVAWACLIGVVVLLIAVGFYRSRRNGTPSD